MTLRLDPSWITVWSGLQCGTRGKWIIKGQRLITPSFFFFIYMIYMIYMKYKWLTSCHYWIRLLCNIEKKTSTPTFLYGSFWLRGHLGVPDTVSGPLMVPLNYLVILHLIHLKAYTLWNADKCIGLRGFKAHDFRNWMRNKPISS